MGRLRDVLVGYAPLGFVSFGGPPANVAMMHSLFVEKRKWVDDAVFTELMGISNALPGSLSTQLVFAIAVCHGGLAAGLVGFLLWSLPMMIVMTCLAIGVSHISTPFPAVVVHLTNGLVSVAVGLVAVAAYKLSQKVVTDTVTMLVCAGAACVSVAYSAAWVDPSLMVAGGLLTFLWDTWQHRTAHLHLIPTPSQDDRDPFSTSCMSPESRGDGDPSSPGNTEISVSVQEVPAVHEIEIGLNYSPLFGGLVIAFAAAVFAVLLVARSLMKSPPIPLSYVTNVFIAGSIIFGSGPVVVPLMHAYVVDPGWLSEQEFLLGVAFVNILPGPNFNFGAYCGALAMRSPTSYALLGAILGYVGIYFPGIALKLGVLPLWKHLRGRPSIKSFLRGVSAAAVGLVFYAVYILWQKAVSLPDGTATSLDGHSLYVILTTLTFVAVGLLSLPAPAVVVFGGVVGVLEWFATR
eukprot:RCo051583